MNTKPLSAQEKLALRRNAHSLKPIVSIGQAGLSTPVHEEIERALYDHELVKIRMYTQDRSAKKQWIEQICHEHQAQLIQTIGHVVVIYRQSSKHADRKAQSKS